MRYALWLWVLGIAGLTAPVLAQSMTEYPIPYADSRPRDPFAVSADTVWFVGQLDGYLGRLNPQTGAVSQIDLGEGAGPHNVIASRDGRLWVAGNRRGHISVHDASGRMIRSIDMPEDAFDPHTLVLDANQSHLFFTVQGGNFVGRIDTKTYEDKLTPIKTQGARPYGIRVAPDGTVWATLFGSHKIARIDPETVAVTEIALPRTTARPRRLGITSDGRIWTVDHEEGMLSVYNPVTQVWREWNSPSGAKARPYGMAVDGRDRLWYVETGVRPNRMIGFDPALEEFIFNEPIGSGGRSVRHMHYHAGTQSVWFGTDANTIGQLKLQTDPLN